MSINTNDLLQAIDIVAESRAKKYHYDETIEAKIISTQRKAEGIYKVEYENGKFDAYSNDTQSYYENEYVYVMIPKGDLTQQKYIIGRKVDAESENATYNFNFKLPFDNFIGLENLTYGQNIATKKYLANKPSHGVATSADINTLSASNANYIWSWERESDDPVIETKLGIAADFKTLLGKYRPRAGRYGLRVDVTGRTLSVEGENSKIKTTTYYFTNDDMYGNTYAFYEPTQQQVIFDISEYATLNKIIIAFYQDHGFYDVVNTAIPYQSAPNTNENKNLLPANIIISDLQVLLGLTTDECKTDRVFLYTYDDMYYGYDPEDSMTEYADYHARYSEIQHSNLPLAEETAALEALVQEYIDQPGYEWLKPERKLRFAWVHLNEGTPVLVNHYYKRNDKDVNSFEYWQEKVGSKLQWYHYEYACDQDTTDLPQRQGGVNWKYLMCSTEGLGEDYDYTNYNLYTVTPDATHAHEQWKAIVTVNNVPYTTEPLIFTNVDSTVQSSGESLNEITFRFLREDIIDDEGTINIIEDNTLRDFFVYDENNNVLKDKDNIRYSDRWYYVQVWMRNNETGQYLPMTYDPDQWGINVTWFWDDDSTGSKRKMSMIESWTIPTQQELAQAVLAPTLEGASQIYNDQILLITRKFKIRSRLDISYLNNTISAIVTRKTKTYHPQMELHFGQAGSMGSAYTITMQQLAPEGQYLIKDKQFSIVANVIEKGKTVAESSNSKYLFAWECLSPTIITESAEESIVDSSGKNKQAWIQEDGAYFIGNKITGYIRSDDPPVFKVTVAYAADYYISETFGFKIIATDNDTPLTVTDAAGAYTTNCPNRVEFKSDGSVPLALMSTFSVMEFLDGEQQEIYPGWTLEQYHQNGSQWVRTSDYFALKAETTYDTAVLTNANPTMWVRLTSQPIAYNTIDYDNGYSLVETASHNYYTSYVSLRNWIVEAYEKGLEELEGTENDILQRKNALAEEENDRLNKLALAASQCVPEHTVYRLDPYIRNTQTTANWYWEEGLEKYYTVLQWEYIANNETITCRQAVPFARNLWSSSLLNNWEGQLTIDEAENAILAQMISAGVKNSNNTFTGVVMGDWHDRADTSLDIPGLYGILNGGQVFGFRTDGTGFIGKSGRGQIQFDGNQSLISNSDKTMYLNLDPIRYDYNADGTISFRDYYSKYSYFLYAETRKTSTASLIGEENLEESTAWASKFLNDSGKDYFIVDPNNGVLTSGGIIARYGKIGNWMISAAGLYQKYTGANRLSSRYMYLGYPSNVLDNANAASAAYNIKLLRLKIKKETALRQLYEAYVNNQIEFLGKYYKQIYLSDPTHFYNYGWTVQSAQLAADEVLNIYASDSTIDIITTFENSYTYYVDNDPRCRQHTHYNAQGNPVGYGYVTGYAPSWWITNARISEGASWNSIQKKYIGNNSVGGSCQVTSFSSSNTNGEYNPSNSTGEQNTYWGASYSNVGSENDPTWLWINRYQSYGATGVTIPRLSTKSLTAANLQSASNQWKAWYDYQTDAYNKQLDAMLEAGMAYLKELPEYEEYKRQLEQLKQTYLAERANLTAEYDDLIQEITTLQSKIIETTIAEDKNQYAIFAGYTPNSTPLFSVNWRGAMTAREALLGHKSPWLVMDYGLTQSNNFGTIFLGNPEAPYDMETWTTLGDNIVTYNNDHTLTVKVQEDETGDTTSRIMYSLKNATSGANAGPPAYGTKGRFAIAAGNVDGDRTIHFGVRMDGTIFSDRGKIGGWRITEGMLVNYKNDTPVTFDDDMNVTPSNGKEIIALDAANNEIRLANHQIVIDGENGILFIGARGKNKTTGEFYLASHHFEGSTQGSVSFSEGSANVENVTVNKQVTQVTIPDWNDLGQTHPGGNYTYSYSYQTTHLTNAPTIRDRPTLTASKFAGNKLTITETLSTYESKTFGVTINNLQQYENSTYGRVIHTEIYPLIAGTAAEPNLHGEATTGWLGNPKNPWNLYAQTVYAPANAIWMGDCLVATEDWVADIVSKVHENLLALDAAVTSAFSKINSSLSQLWTLVKANFGGNLSGNHDILDDQGNVIGHTTNSIVLNPCSIKGSYGNGKITFSGNIANNTPNGDCDISGIFEEAKNSELKITLKIANTSKDIDLTTAVEKAFEDGWEAACGSATLSTDKKSLKVTSPAGKEYTFDLTETFNAGKASLKSSDISVSWDWSDTWVGTFTSNANSTGGNVTAAGTITVTTGENTSVTKNISDTQYVTLKVDVPTGGGSDSGDTVQV